MSLDEQALLEAQLKAAKQRMHIRELEKAKRGISADPYILIDIDDAKREIKEIEAKLAALKAKPAIGTGDGGVPSQTGTGDGGVPSQTGTVAPVDVKTVPPREPEAIPLTMRITPQADGTAEIIWEADVLGRRQSTFRSPYDGVTLASVLKALDALQYGLPSVGSRLSQNEKDQLTALGFWVNEKLVPDISKRVGQAIYQALVADPEGIQALGIARNHAIAQDLPLSYLLRFPADAVELAALPWELLWSEKGALLLQGKQAPWVRYLDLDQALPPAAQPGSTLRILAVAPQARISDQIRTEERDARKAAWAELEKAGAVTMEELNPATRAGLVDRIQNGPPVDILHYYGHGRYMNGEGALLFDTPEGGETWVSADRLAALLGGGNVRLVMMHACQSATVGDAGLLTGIAPALSAAGVPAVVAMQLTVRVKAATRFAGVVYRDLARGVSVQRAVSQARQALYVEDDDGTSWYVPTLTIRARNVGPMRLVQQQ